MPGNVNLALKPMNGETAGSKSGFTIVVLLYGYDVKFPSKICATSAWGGFAVQYLMEERIPPTSIECP